MEIQGKYTKAIVYAPEIDKTTYAQILQIVNHPTFTNPVCIMPDTHAGASNSVIGFTMPLSQSVIPNTVGVDIGCGMISMQINEKLHQLNFPKLDKKIRQVVPIGNQQGTHKHPFINFANQFPYSKASQQLYNFTKKYNAQFGTQYTPIEYNFAWFQKLCKRIDIKPGYVIRSLGTLGGGNHFIEIGQSTADDTLWLTVHSGSRMLGQRIAQYHSRIAKHNMAFNNPQFQREFQELKERLVKNGKQKKINKERKKLKDKYLKNNPKIPANMEFLEGQDLYNYFIDMIFAQTYAQENRKKMLEQILTISKLSEKQRIESIHNYIDFDDLIIRKGAIPSYQGKNMIIPFNMADGILICEGKSNPRWNYSAPHGAGRIMSRAQARKQISIDEFQQIMKKRKIFTTSVSVATLDEAPQVYKNARMIEKAIEPTARILFKIKPLYNLKAEN